MQGKMRKICAVSFLTRGEQNLPCQRGPSLYFLLKLIDLPDLADYRHTVPLLKGIVYGINIIAVEHGNQTNVEFAADYTFKEGDSVAVIGKVGTIDKFEKEI